MSLKKLFKPKFTTGQAIKIVTPSGAMLDSCDVNIGHLTGRSRCLTAILCDGADDDEPWHIINLIDNSGALLDHIAIQGAVSHEQAKRLCNKYLPQMQNGHIRNVVTMTDNALKTFIDGATIPSNTPYILDYDANLLDLKGSVEPVVWSEDNCLLSHGGHISKVMYDMACCDVRDDLLAQVSPRDIIKMMIDGTCEFGAMMDAMIIKYRQFDTVIQKIAEALKSYDHEDLFVKSVTPIEPFKRNSVVNVGAIFTMSDSQTITVLFNNPDTTPAKLTADDVLTSWKWMLNKRDVTAVLQPRAVEAKKYTVIAGRIIKLFARNHDRFKRNQMIREKDELLLNELLDQVEAKQSEVRFLDNQIQKQQQEIDAETVRKQNQTEIGKADITAVKPDELDEETATQNQNEQNEQNEQNVQINNNDNAIVINGEHIGAVPEVATETTPEAVTDPLDVSMANKKNSVLLAEKLKEFASADWVIEKTIDDVKNLSNDQFRELYQKDVDNLQNQYDQVISAFNTLFRSAMVKDQDKIQEVANEVNYIYKMLAPKAKQLQIAWQKLGQEYQKAQSINPEPKVKSETEQFLQSVIDGTADMSDQAFSDKLLAVADNLDPSLESLFEQASDAYADYAINLEV